MSTATPVMEHKFVDTDTDVAVDTRKLEFTLKHRCDSCGITAQAYMAYWKPDKEYPLLFCIHHANRYKKNLLSQGFREQDESARLTDNGTKPDGGSAAG